ncbi:MAG: peptide transporter [Oscillospiraceae bacterium]|nr:peptide transporter [Oscillospiraceae bacterium]
MRHLLRLTDLTKNDISDIFRIADSLCEGGYRDFLAEKTAVMFFPSSSIRTRVSFEKGIYLLGGQTILFPPEALDKKEDILDAAGYLGNWADILIIRHKDISVLEKTAEATGCPVINAMTDVNHPCEILSDLYALSKLGRDITADRYLFMGTGGNIGLAWKEAAQVLGFELTHCCPDRFRMDGVSHEPDLRKAMAGKDIICTDSIPAATLTEFSGYTITSELMSLANDGALLDPCPPFYRGEEVSAEVIDSSYFVGYGFKKYLLPIQQAVLIWSLS